ncbi:MAG: SDR family oxidoreductase, partial [Chloroflexota bacterium]
RAIALTLAEAGADIAIVARAPEAVSVGTERIHRPLDPAVAQVRERGRRAIGILADVREPEEMAAMATQVRDELGRVDILVNNAGATWGETFRMGPLLEMSAQDLDECLRLNLKSFFHVSAAVAPLMLQQGKGVILNMASASGQGASPGNGLYGAAKAGVISLTLTMAQEWAPAIRVNAIAPGTIAHADRAAVHPYAPPGSRGPANIPLGRTGAPEDIAGAALYLVSDAAAYTTGAVLDINGGRQQP